MDRLKGIAILLMRLFQVARRILEYDSEATCYSGVPRDERTLQIEQMLGLNPFDVKDQVSLLPQALTTNFTTR